MGAVWYGTRFRRTSVPTTVKEKERARLQVGLAAFTAALESDGLFGGLRFLNQRTPHRFSGIYRFAGGELHNIHLYDRENPVPTVAPVIALGETYCSLVGGANHPLVLTDTRHDPRAADHPARESIVSYTGAPIPNPDGSPFGTLCHFDMRPHLFGDLDIALLTEAARLLRTYID